MSIKVFISWSGERSRKLGEAICNWLPSVLQNAQPYFTPNDIQKGAKWSSEISLELETSNIGIICLTKENKEKPWIMFEAGALAKKLNKSKVCALLFGMDNSDLSGPLTQFQSTLFAKDEIKKLLHSINDAAQEDTKVQDQVLENTFEMCWTKLENDINIILSDNQDIEESEEANDRDIIVETLELVRDMHSGRSEEKFKEEINKLQKEIESLKKENSSITKEYSSLQQEHIKVLEDYNVSLNEYTAALEIIGEIKSTEDTSGIVSTIRNSSSIDELLKPNK